MKPDLSILSDVISIANQWEQTGEPPTSLLKKLWPVLVAVVPEVTALRLYRALGNTLLPAAATDRDLLSTPDPVSLDDDFLCQIIPNSDGLVHDNGGERWGCGLRWEDRLFFALEFVVEKEKPPTPEAREWLAAIAAHLTTTLKLHLTHNRMQRLALATNELVAGQGAEEMALILARRMLPHAGRLVSIGSLSYDEQSRITGWDLLVAVNHEGLVETAEKRIPWEEVGPAIQSAILDGEPFVCNDCEKVSMEEIGPAFYERLQKQGTQAYLNIPFTLTDQSIASVAILSRDKNVFPPEEVEVFRDLAVLLGALIDVNRLSQQNEIAHGVVDDLVLANRLIATAANSAYMAQAIIYTLGKELVAVAITMFDRPLDVEEQPEAHNVVAFSTETDVVELDRPLPTQVPTPQAVNRLHAGLPLVMRDEVARAQIPKRLQSDPRAAQVNWMALFGLRSGNQLVGTLSLMASSPRELTEAETSAYTTLADQVGVVLRSRQLLQISRQAHALTSQLVRTNRAISAAADYDEMVQVTLQSLPEHVKAIAFLLFDIPVVGETYPSSAKTAVIATRDSVLHPGLVDEIDPQHPRFIPVTSQLSSGQPVVIDDIRQIDPFMKNSAGYFVDMGIYRVVLVGLQIGSRLLGMLLSGLAEDTQLSDLEMDNFLSIADQTAITIENRNLFNQTTEALGFVHAQFETTSTIYHADDPVQMLEAVHKFAVFSEDHFASGLMALAEEGDGDEAKQVLRVIAEIESGKARAATRTVSASGSTGPDRLMVSKPVIIFDIAQDQTLSAEDLAHLQKKNTQAILTLPMFTSGRELLGVIHFTHTRPVEMPLDRLRALSTLVEQVAVVLDNRNLLQQTAQSLEEARTLYNTNRDLLTAQDSREVLEAIQKNLTPDALSISLFSINWGELGGDIGGFEVECFLADTGKQEPERDISNLVTRSKQVQLIEDIAPLLKSSPEMAYFHDQGARSLVMLPVYEEGRLQNQVNIAFAEPRTFDARTRRLFDAVRDQVTVVLQNQRLLRDTQTIVARLGDQVRVLQTINHLATTLAGSQEEQVLMETTCEALVNALRVDHVSLGLVNPDGRTITIASEYPQRGAGGISLVTDTTWQNQLSGQHLPVTVHVGKDKLDDTTRQMFDQLGMKSALVLPLLDARARYIGMISLNVRQEDFTFPTEQIDIARTITAQIAVSLQNIRLLQSTQRQAAQMEQIANFSRTIQTTLEVARLLEIGLDHVTQIITADHTAIMLYDSTKGRLQTVAWKESDEKIRVSLADGPPVNLERTTAGRVWRTRSPLFIADLDNETDLEHPFLGDTRTVMATPIYTRGAMSGIIELAHTRPAAYSPTDQIIFRQIANQLSVAIENAESYAQSQRLAMSKALVNEISSQLQRQTEIERLLDVTMLELGKALGARRARIRLTAEAISDE